jgi:hypothetical protein
VSGTSPPAERREAGHVSGPSIAALMPIYALAVWGAQRTPASLAPGRT